MSRKSQIGIVTSIKMQKTIIVLVEKRYKHPLYLKTVTKRKKYAVHDEDQKCSLGDKIIIEETRPLSKTKRWIFKKFTS